MNLGDTQRFHFLFEPWTWDAPSKFLRFLGPPFSVSRQLNDAVRSCSEHLQKFQTFATIAEDIRPTLRLDREELERTGHTPARRLRQFAALVETLVCELYSMLDGVRYTLFAIYRRCRGVQQSSTEKLFSRAAASSYGQEFPEELRRLLADAYCDWFLRLRHLRTAFTHGGLGTCSLPQDGDTVSYMNASLGTDSHAHVIEDVVSEVNRLTSGVFVVLNGVFEYLYSQLEPVASDQVCGIYKQRIYLRKVEPTSTLHRGSGRCESRQWFDNELERRCPLAVDCEAYRRNAA